MIFELPDCFLHILLVYLLLTRIFRIGGNALENFIVCLNAVAPIFIIIALGYMARRLGDIKREDVFRFNRLIFRYFIPVMVFYNIYVSDLAASFNVKLLCFALLGVLAEWFVSMQIVKRTERRPERRGVIIQALYRSNFVIIGLPLAQQLMPAGSDFGCVVILLATVVPLYNILAVITLEHFGGAKKSRLGLVVDILKNPMIVGTFIGIAFQLLKLRLPSGLEHAAAQLANATSPIMLFLLGGFFEFSDLRDDLKTVSAIVIGRLIIIPAVVLGLACMIGFRGVEFASLLGAFASSTAIASFTMAQQMGGDAKLAGNAVVATSALCSLTLFLWAMIFKTVGVI